MCQPAPEAGYLKDEIARSGLLDVRTETPPSFRSLFLEILQDLEKSEENTQVVEKALHAGRQDRKREKDREKERVRSSISFSGDQVKLQFK